MDNKRKIEVLKQAKESIITEKWCGNFICNHIKASLDWSDESYEITDWLASTKNLVPNELRNENWSEQENVFWKAEEVEMRIKYIDYLINQLENGNL